MSTVDQDDQKIQMPLNICIDEKDQKIKNHTDDKIVFQFLLLTIF